MERDVRGLLDSPAGTRYSTYARKRSRYQRLCDSQTFELLDRSERQESRFALADLPRHIEGFGFTLGVWHRTFRDQDPMHVETSEPVSRFHHAFKASG